MIDQVRETLRKATKVVDAPRRRTEEAVRKIAERPNIDLLDAPHLAWEFLQKGRKQAERAKAVLDAQVRRRLREMGLATKEEMDALKRRITELEAASHAAKAAAATETPAAEAKQVETVTAETEAPPAPAKPTATRARPAARATRPTAGTPRAAPSPRARPAKRSAPAGETNGEKAGGR